VPRRRLATVAYQISQETNNAWGQATSAVSMALGSLEIGEWAEALTITKEAVTQARALGHSVICGFPWTHCAFKQGRTWAGRRLQKGGVMW
jgi:hypothetical protein